MYSQQQIIKTKSFHHHGLHVIRSEFNIPITHPHTNENTQYFTMKVEPEIISFPSLLLAEELLLCHIGKLTTYVYSIIYILVCNDYLK